MGGVERAREGVGWEGGGEGMGVCIPKSTLLRNGSIS